jgi:hypothetical protein
MFGLVLAQIWIVCETRTLVLLSQIAQSQLGCVRRPSRLPR